MQDQQFQTHASDRRHAPPAGRQGPAEREQWWLWPVISLLGYIAVLAVNYLANSLPLNDQQTGDITDAYIVPFQPAGWVFGTIWPTIYLLLGIYIVYSFLPAGRRHSLIDSIGPILLVANIANISWLFAWHWERLVPALVILAILAASLATIYLRIRTARRDAEDMSALQQALLAVPFSVYLAWACIATLANVQILMSEWGWNGLDAWTVVLLVIGIVLAATMALRWQDVAFPLVFAYAYSGIANRQWGEDTYVGTVAIVMAVIAVALAIVALVGSFRDDSANREETPVVGSFTNE
jgi:translocator protein